MSGNQLPAEQGMKAIALNSSILSAEERKIVDILIANDQAHLFAHWPAAGEKDADKHRFLFQCAAVEKDYVGGIAAYVQRARQLLKFAQIGGNPYEGYKVSEPQSSVRLETPADFTHYESLGLNHLHECAFVIVAGGLGERLGYKGIKLSLPSEILTETSFIHLYIQHILAMQTAARRMTGKQDLQLPLGIMTSDDTDKLTRELLAKYNNFGMSDNQLVIFKQGKVPSLVDNAAHFCLDENDAFTLDTKPHGHGDVHQLLYQHDLVEKWVQHGVKYITFFQDTNGLVFHAILAAVGVSVKQKLIVNSIAVPRVQGDAVGAICRLERQSNAPVTGEELPSTLTINVEYNQLEGLLGKGAKEPTVAGTNTSVYPGNINVLIFDAPHYLQVLKEKKGVICEFVNPKYNADKQSFKKPTRLECMMQDYPKLLPASAAVGFAQFQRWTSFSAVKNAIKDGAEKQKQGNAAEVAATGEADLFNFNYQLFKQVGVQIATPTTLTFHSVNLNMPPKIVLSPEFGLSQDQIKAHFIQPANVNINNSSCATALIVLAEHITVKSLQLDGALIIRAVPEAKVTIDGLTVKNRGWTYESLLDEEMKSVDQKYAVRGYVCKRHETEEYVFDKAGEYTLSDQTKHQYRKY